MTERRIGVFTSSRADLGPLGPVIRELDAHPSAHLVVIASGTHLADVFGGTLTDLELSRSSSLETLDVGIADTTPDDLGQVYGRIGGGISEIFQRIDLDILVLLGDRWELLAIAGVALIHGIPIAHLHGGETTEGAIDERIRHGLTKLSDLHLCATPSSARRIRYMGEEPWRIIVTGAPGLDRMEHVDELTDSQIQQIIGKDVVRPLGVVVYHPPTVDRSRIRQQAQRLYDESASKLGTIIALYPGADPGSQVIVDELQAASLRHSNLTAERNLSRDYLSILKSADVLIGNSSSGIIEAASLCVPAIDIGDRQAGRLRPDSVIHIDELVNLPAAIDEVLAPNFQAKLPGITNPYGDGSASERIVREILSAPLGDLAHKPWANIAESSQVSVDDLIIECSASIRDVMAAIERGRNKIAIVVDDAQKLVGTLTDGDLRRAILEGAALDDPALEHVTQVPVVATPSDESTDVLSAMERNRLTSVPIVDKEDHVVGLHVMHTILGNIWPDAGKRPAR